MEDTELPYFKATDCATGKGEYENSESLIGKFAVNRALENGSVCPCIN